MSSTSSSSDEEESVNKKQNSFIVKKPHFLRRARTLPYELRLLKQRQDGRRRELERRQHDDIIDHLSVIEMELSAVNELLDEDVEKSIKEELYSDYNIPRPTVPILNEIYSEPSMPILDLSVEQSEPPEWEENTQPVTNYESETNYTADVPSTSESQSRSWQNSTEQHSPFTETKETTADIENIQEVNSDHEDDGPFTETKETSTDDIDLVEEEDNDNENDVIIIEEIENSALTNKSVYQRYREMREAWSSRVQEIKEELRKKYRISSTSASSLRIQNFKNLLCYVREIERLLQKPNIMRDEEHYAQLQARVSNTKFMEVCDLGQFNYLDGRSILTLRQADKELAEFQYEWWKSKMNLNDE